MSGPEKYTIGCGVWCSDGRCGELGRLIVDPVARVVTHLVVQPGRWGGMGHLVPIDLVDSAAVDGIRLRCATAEFEALPDGQETQFLPGASGQWGYGQELLLSWPYYGLSLGGTGAGGVRPNPQPVSYDRIPAGEVEVQRGDRVHASDGTIGRVRGLVVDPVDHHVTHVLLAEGHLWGQRRVAIPISAVSGVQDGVRLTLSKDQVRDLPPVDLDPSDDQRDEPAGSAGQHPRTEGGAVAHAEDTSRPRIVVGVDGSEGSRDALRWAAGQAAITSASLEVLSTWMWPPASAYLMVLPDTVDLRAEAEAMLAQVVRETLGEDPLVAVRTVVVEGPAAATLIKHAAGAVLLVVGSRGHGAFAEMLLGSVSQHCVTHAPCPVVVVRTEH